MWSIGCKGAFAHQVLWTSGLFWLFDGESDDDHGKKAWLHTNEHV